MISSYSAVQLVKFRFPLSSKLRNTIFSAEIPLDKSSFLKASRRVDFPQRRIPVMTFIKFWSLSCFKLL